MFLVEIVCGVFVIPRNEIALLLVQVSIYMLTVLGGGAPRMKKVPPTTHMSNLHRREGQPCLSGYKGSLLRSSK